MSPAMRTWRRAATLVSAPLAMLAVTTLVVSPAAAQSAFVNWETPHVHPLDLTPDGQTLLAVNTADNRLEVFSLAGGYPRHTASVPVGLDPVSVRARSNAEAWVANHVSDSVSVVSLATLNVIATLRTDDEPCDVVFAGTPQRAFVSCSAPSTVLVFDPANLALAPTRINLLGEDPRALAVNAAGTEVYIAIFESGNRSTILGGGSTIGGGFPPNVVNDSASPYVNPGQPLQLGINPPNPPPNDGVNFKPPQRPGNPPPPRVGLIVKKDPAGRWMDDNNHEWTNLVSGPLANRSGRLSGWDLYDHDLAIIDVATLDVRYATDCMNLCMALAVNPGTGQVTVVGTDANNEVRYEPVLQGRFLRVNLARVMPSAVPSTLAVVDLNPHLTYGTDVPFVPIPQNQRDWSLGDPRGIAWNATGTRGFVTGMGSNNVIVVNSDGDRFDTTQTIDVGEGPTGVVFDAARDRVYVLNKFDASLSVIDAASEVAAGPDVPFYDPTPAAIRTGRRHLYNTHINSGLGHIACASCHIDAGMDRLGWDLGDPDGSVKTFNQNCNAGLPLGGACADWHPMKGPMTTQTLKDIIGKEPHHWRGDRDGLEEFANAFAALQGRDAPLPAPEMQEFENFLASIHFPPNPFRNFDNSLPTSLPLPGHFTPGRFAPAGQPLPNGNAVTGLSTYRTAGLDGGLNCVTCHTLPTGAGTDYRFGGASYVPIPPGPNGERHLALVTVDGSTNISIKIPQTRNMYDKVGFELTQLRNTAGFGYLHDGSVDSLARFVSEPVFSVSSDQMIANLVAMQLAFAGSDLPLGSPTSLLEPPGPPSRDMHAAVGWQTTLVSEATAPAAQLTLITNMIAQAQANRVGLVVNGLYQGEARGFRYNIGGTFQSDRAAQSLTTAQLRAAAAPGAELTYTVVPRGSETRIGVDRDLDGYFDRDELDECSDPADAASIPGGPGVTQVGDANCDGLVNNFDIDAFVLALTGGQTAWEAAFSCNYLCANDANGDGVVNNFDIDPFVAILAGP
ncbi:MAG: hypothetical protein AB7Q17_09555 [Phycisphaerae bacterium]